MVGSRIFVTIFKNMKSEPVCPETKSDSSSSDSYNDKKGKERKREQKRGRESKREEVIRRLTATELTVLVAACKVPA